MTDRIFFGVPCATRNIDCECAISIFKQVHRVQGQTYFHMGISDIALARNLVIHKFLKSDCDWLMMVDSDILFTDDDFDYLWEGQDLIVTAPYARKIPGSSPANFGLGFTRVHRRVFEAIQDLTDDEGKEYANKFYMDGDIHTHYFPVGVTGDSRWLGEDRGFFTLCAMTGINFRMENRCRLRHVGFFIYGFPDQNGGAKFWQPEKNPDEGPQEGDDRPIVVM